MRRIEVKYDGDVMTISQSRIASVTDAAINACVGAVMTIPFGAMMAITIHPIHYQDQGPAPIPGLLNYVVAFLIGTPIWIFGLLAIRSIYQALLPSKILIDRNSGEWRQSTKMLGLTSSISNLEIRYTGFRGPSRYALDTILDNGRRYALISTGYTGSREELVTLTELISDFTNRPDLCVR